MVTGMIGAVKHQLDTKKLHREFNGTVENSSRGQFKANCSSHQYVQHVPPAVLHTIEPSQSDHHNIVDMDTVSKVAQPSATSSTWMTSTHMLGSSETSTH